MKNRDKYREILMDYAMVNVTPALTKKGSITRCKNLDCDECAWNIDCGCEAARLEWLDEEYREPKNETDWSKVPVDTPIYVGETMEEAEEKKIPRYFAKYENGKIYAWLNGATSFTTHNTACDWRYAKLAEV